MHNQVRLLPSSASLAYGPVIMAMGPFDIPTEAYAERKTEVNVKKVERQKRERNSEKALERKTLVCESASRQNAG